MKAEIYMVDDNGKRIVSIPQILEPFGIRDNGITTTYTFAFEFSKIDEDAFSKIISLKDKEEAEQCDDDCEHCEYATCPKMEVGE